MPSVDRSEISRRLKAARWLAGGEDANGRPTPLSAEDLAELQPLRRNGITANAIGEIERKVKDARPMELREIREALGLPMNWFEAPTYREIGERDAASALLRRVEAVLATPPGERPAPQPGGELGRRLQAQRTTAGDPPPSAPREGEGQRTGAGG